jgi:hypothetical protein
MHSRSRRVLALILCAAVTWPGGPSAKAQAPAGPAAGDLAGSWVGWAKLANDWPGLACRYGGGLDATSVQLELTADGASLKGSVAIDLPAEPASGCPPLRKRYSIAEATQGPGALSFTDSGGNEWTLSVRRSGSVLQGLLAWQQGGPEEPLAQGFTGPGGVRPGSRLSGEVRLSRGAEAEPEKAAEAAEAAPAGAAPEKATAKKPTTGAGRHLENIGIVVGANVVGLGLLYGVNKAGQGSSETGVVTCSPRTCIVGPAINDPCYCEGNVVSGAACGTSQTGAAINAPCQVPTVPCQAGLSCNSGFCQDRDGRCPY